MKRYTNGIPSSLQFVEVTGDDGTFYDLCRTFEVSKHVDMLTAGGYAAAPINTKDVPPCQFRDFSNGLGSYADAIWDSGKDFYHWGGKRPGSGRKPLAEKRKRYTFRLTEPEHKKAREYIAEMKSRHTKRKEEEKMATLYHGDEYLGEIITNQSLSVEDACELLNIDINEMDEYGNESVWDYELFRLVY
jgi:hypothetical protein